MPQNGCYLESRSLGTECARCTHSFNYKNFGQNLEWEECVHYYRSKDSEECEFLVYRQWMGYLCSNPSAQEEAELQKKLEEL